ncbi:hypothetical protein NDU88_009024 [Pleurodeles waltl]|uniref:Uncharacterized protein n=1 Tax=Pleurodeles waltl TaxID=8319 RepID=A0AAV7QQG2_PLEWA|nr:hypothetical protein NDU88_009024 [Pleurodeles waltl]
MFLLLISQQRLEASPEVPKKTLLAGTAQFFALKSEFRHSADIPLGGHDPLSGLNQVGVRTSEETGASSNKLHTQQLPGIDPLAALIARRLQNATLL